MIPKTIHYCWFGRGEMPQLAIDCIASWHKFMPGWEYKLWNEDTFDVNSVPYVKEAYESKKYAFVSDYVRLYALYHEGGLYMDVDFEVYKPFDDLMSYSAFSGYEGSKHCPIMMGVLASEPGGEWVKEQICSYSSRHFILDDGSLDLTTNVTDITNRMVNKGLVCSGIEQDFHGLHIFPVDYFCPRLTNGEYIISEKTYCEHKGLNSWNRNKGIKSRILDSFNPKVRTRLINIKRILFG